MKNETAAGSENMRYQNVKEAIFLSRPNRFTAKCLLDGEEVAAHVKNTGRCKELLIPGTRVWLEKAASAERKTAWSLITVEKTLETGEKLLVNLDSQAPNIAAYEAAKAGTLPFTFLQGKTLKALRREVFFEDSRYDLHGETEAGRFFIEVKGVMLERDGAAWFPDAPTERGIKHLDGLCRAVQEGYRCGVLFVVQMERADYFSPNRQTHAAFGEALQRAAKAGVEIIAMCCRITPEEIHITHSIPVRLREEEKGS